MDTNNKNKGKRDAIIMKFIENEYVNRKLKKGGVVIPCHERLCTVYKRRIKKNFHPIC